MCTGAASIPAQPALGGFYRPHKRTIGCVCVCVCTAVLLILKCILSDLSFLCISQCGTSFSRASLTGCGGSVWRSNTMQRRHRMKTRSWCSRLELSLCPPSHTCCAAWHPMHGTSYTLIILNCQRCEVVNEFFMALNPFFFFFCRGIFKLLVKFQLENKDNPSYTGTHVHEPTKCGFPLQHDYFA